MFKIIDEYVSFMEHIVVLYFYKLSVFFGMIMRLVLHIVVPVGVYFWIYPPSLGDIPLSQLTGNQIGSSIICSLVGLGAFINFFSFPDTNHYLEGVFEDETENEKEILILKSNPYFAWASYSYAVIFILILIIAWMAIWP